MLRQTAHLHPADKGNRSFWHRIDMQRPPVIVALITNHDNMVSLAGPVDTGHLPAIIGKNLRPLPSMGESVVQMK